MIPKSSNPGRIAENLKATELKLDAEDMRRLRELDRNYRFIRANFFFKTGESLEDFWDVVEDEKFIVKPPDNKKQKT